jgi:hypothetical protein
LYGLLLVAAGAADWVKANASEDLFSPQPRLATSPPFRSDGGGNAGRAGNNKYLLEYSHPARHLRAIAPSEVTMHLRQLFDRWIGLRIPDTPSVVPAACFSECSKSHHNS